MKNSNKLYWKAVGVTELGYAAITTSLILLVAVVYIIHGYLPNGFWKIFFYSVGFVNVLTIAVMIWIMLFTPFFCSVHFWERSPGSDSYREYLNEKIRTGWLFFKHGNPITLSCTLTKLLIRTFRTMMDAIALAKER